MDRQNSLPGTPAARTAQSGYSLLEMSIVLFIGAGFLLAMTMVMHTHLLQLRSQTMAQRYQSVLSAAQAYMDNFGPLLIQLPADCGAPLYRIDHPIRPPLSVSVGDCSLTLDHEGRRVRLANALQPQTQELKTLGLLDAQASSRLIMEHQTHVRLPQQSGGKDTNAPPELGVRVRRICQTSSCPGPIVLEALVYNLQPFLLSGGNWTLNRRDQVNLLFETLGNDAAMSEAGIQQGALITRRAEFRFSNPVRDMSGQGVAGIVAVRASTHATVGSAWVRRDGQSRISGSWDFATHDVKGVGRLGANAVEAKNLQLSGRAQVHEASAQMIDVNRLSVANLKLPQAVRGQACDPATGNLALDDGRSRLLTCDPVTLTWMLP